MKSKNLRPEEKEAILREGDIKITKQLEEEAAQAYVEKYWKK